MKYLFSSFHNLIIFSNELNLPPVPSSLAEPSVNFVVDFKDCKGNENEIFKFNYLTKIGCIVLINFGKLSHDGTTS